MSLSDGTRLGVFEIKGQIGAGGMGEVYRATDTKLGRDVAIKTLPAALAEDADRLARFEREAKLLATLNHAHIAVVHSLDETDGTLYIVMELVEGESLERRIEAGAIPLEDALDYGLQIASALEAAHEKGVVHRDLKPANIMITPDGVIKVLDFGLAKAFVGDGTQKSAAHSPALSVAMTQQGLVLGTAGYMSPEQASGQATDQRADVWAFGVVMYEMLTGQALFTGESVPHILADVLKTTPDWNRLPERLHPRLRQMLERCLTKRPRDRYAGIADARVDIEAALRDPEGAEARLQSSGSSGTTRPGRQRIWPIAAAFAIGLAAAGVSAWVVLKPQPRALEQFDITPEEGFPVSVSSGSIAISPDGRSVAYLSIPIGGGPGGRQLRLRRLDQLGSSLLLDLVNSTGAEEPNQMYSPFFSPDGTQVAYYDAAPTNAVSTLRRISTQGGAPSTITALPGNMRGATWGDDGTIIYATANVDSGLWRVRATGGEPERLTTPDAANGAINHFWPEMLPGSEAVLFTIVRGTEDESQIAVLSLATGEERVLINGGTTPRYARSGHLLYGRAGTLFAVPFDAASLEILGDAVPVRENIATKGAEGATEFMISVDGTLLYVDGEQADAASRSLLWVDTNGNETTLPTPPRLYDQVVLSPNERQAAVRLENDPSVWIADLERGTLQRLTEDESSGETVVLFFSDNGRRVAYSVRREGGNSEVVWRPIDGSGQPEVLARMGQAVVTVRAASLTSDGDQILLTLNRPPQAYDVGLVDIGEPDSYRDLISSPSNEYGARPSPDGAWVSFGSDESGTFESYVQRFADGSGRQPITIGGSLSPFWTSDSRNLIYVGFNINAGGLSNVIRLPVSGSDDPSGSITFGEPETLFQFDYYFQIDPRKQFDMTSDGQRFITISATAGSIEGGRMILVQNWFGELRRLAPTD